MIDYTSQYQTKIAAFANLYQLQLDPSNRWIALGYLIPWDKLVALYSKRFSSTMGAKATDPRQIIGAFIIKHKLCLSDEETLQTISENPYMQFFLGLANFSPEPLFSPTLFVEMRKKLGEGAFEAFSNEILHLSHPAPQSKTDEGEQVPNQGKLKIDATVADQYIRYPNDLSLVNEARLKTEAIIDVLYANPHLGMNTKPRTYRRLAHKRYLSEARKKKSTPSSRRKTLRYLLNCVERNIGHIHAMLDKLEPICDALPHKYRRQLWIIDTLYDQQRSMYDKKENRCDDRITSISQPHVRPMVRGKQGKKVEFGAKLGLSLFDGHLSAQTLSWDAYNEAADLPKQATTYKLLTGSYPELIQADKIYATRENRKWCEQRNIRLTASPLGRPQEKSAAQKRKERKEYAERNHIEGRIGNAKQAYSLNQIKARLKETSFAWIGATIFVLNLSRMAQNAGVTF